MELQVGKLYNKGMYLGNTEDLYIDGGELPGAHKNIFLKDDCICETFDDNILEDNDDMLPAKIIYDGKEYILNIRSFELQSGSSIYSLQYQGMKYLGSSKIKALHNIYENDGESIRELIEKFNIHKKSTGYPKEIRYIY